MKETDGMSMDPADGGNGGRNENDDRMFTRISLIGKAKDPNDNDAWSDFNAFYRKYIYNFVRRMGLSHHDADEVVQITLLKVWNALPDFTYRPEKGRFRGWLCRIAGNAARNFVRDRKQPGIALPWDELDGETPEFCAVPPEVELLAEREWQRYLPELALKNISGSFDRKTIQAFTLLRQGLTAKEVAVKLGLAEKSVYVYKQRVAARLSAEIARLKKENL